MLKLDIPEASISPSEEQRITDAIAAIAKDPNAPREVSVRLTLHIHNEYPKHVGSRIVNSAEEEQAVVKEIADNLPEVSGQFAPTSEVK